MGLLWQSSQLRILEEMLIEIINEFPEKEEQEK